MVTMTSDYLTCGECLKEFPLQQITLFIQHKKLGCEDDIGESNPDPELRCNNCPQGFMTAWALLVHAQLTHNLKIFLENASKTVLKNPDLPQIDNGPHLPALEIVKNVESSNTFQGEYDERPMNVDQKPLLLSNGSELFNGIFSSTVQTARSNLAKQTHSPPKQLVLSPNSTANANQSVKMGSTITVTRTIRPKEDTGHYPTSSPERTISSETKQPSATSPQKPSPVLPIVTIQTTAKDQPINTSQPVKVDPPLSSNGSSVALSTSRSPLRLPPTQVLQSNSTKDKVEAAKIVSLTSEAPKSSTLNSDNSSTILAQPKNTTTASNDRIQGINITESSPPSTKTLSVVSVTNNTKSIPQKSSASPNKAFHELTFHDSQQNVVQPLLVDSSMLNIVSNVEKVLEKTATEASPSKKDIEDMCLDTTSSPECCDSQDCGVKVIPGSHEHLKKCCNAVVPKKRKRHMELKHMPFAWSSSRQASRKLLYRSITASSARSAACQFLNKSSANTIYIDLEPDSMAGTQSPSTSETRFKVTRSSSMLDISTNEAIETPSPSQPPGTQSKQRSLILKPCSVFSIPLNYAFSPAQAAANLATPPKKSKTGVDSSNAASNILQSSNIASLVSTSGSEDDQLSLGLPQGNAVMFESVRNSGKISGRSRQPIIKQFKCDKCPAAFNQRIHLQKHTSKHTGIKPFKCGECNYATVERSHLKVHIRIHTGEKPFKCTYCEYATAQNSTLKIHLKRHHAGKMFQCGSCDKQFTQKEQLEIHEWEHENKDLVTPELKIAEDVKFFVSNENTNQDTEKS